MNKITAMVFVPFLLLSCSEWKEKKTTGKVAEKIFYAGFYDQDNACAVGYAGTINYTSNGGEKWKTGTNNSMCMFGLEMIDTKTYIAYGNGANVIISRDGGSTWQHVTDFGGQQPNQCRYGSFASADTGWIANAYTIGETADFGNTWKGIPYDKGLGAIRSVCCTSRGRGYVFTVNGDLLKTENSGKDWIKVTQIIDPKTTPIWTELSKSKQTAQIRFNGDNGIFAFVNEAEKGNTLSIYESKDGGFTWKQEAAIPNKLSTVYISPDMNNISTFNYDCTVTLYSRS